MGGSSYSRSFNLFAQATPWSPQPSSCQEDTYESIWSVIGGGGHFKGTTTAEYCDNGTGLEWQAVAIPAGESFMVGYYWACGALACMGPIERGEKIHIIWPGGTNMVLHWDQPGYWLQASSNALCDWESLPVPITQTEATVEVVSQRNMMYRLALP